MSQEVSKNLYVKESLYLQYYVAAQSENMKTQIVLFYPVGTWTGAPIHKGLDPGWLEIKSLALKRPGFPQIAGFQSKAARERT